MNSVWVFAAIEIVRKLITIIGNVTLSEAVTWLEVKANAITLRQEGHDAEDGSGASAVPPVTGEPGETPPFDPNPPAVDIPADGGE